MDNNDEQKFSEIMAILGKSFTSVDVATQRVYFTYLRDLSIGQVELAANKYILTGRFFPKISELRELAIERKTMTGADALDMVLTHIDKHGFAAEHVVWGEPRRSPLPAIVQRAVRAMGGMEMIAQTPREQMGTLRAQFLRCYNEMAATAHQQELLGEPTPEEAGRILNTLTKQIPAIATIGEGT